MFSFSRSFLPVLALFVGILFGVGGCTHSPERSTSTIADSTLVDSVGRMLEQVGEPASPTSADTARLHRWADRLLSTADSLAVADPDSAHRLFALVRRSGRLLSDSLQRARALQGRGRAFRTQANYDSARTAYRAALDLSRALDRRREIADNLSGYAYILQRQGSYDDALKQYRKALSRYRALGDRRKVSTVMSEVGIIYVKTGRFEKALGQWKEVLSIRRAMEDERGTAQILGNLGILYKNLGQYDKAIAHYRDALSIQRENGWTVDIAKSLSNLGVAYQHLDQYAKALTHLREALSIHRTHEDPSAVAATLNNIGIIYRLQGRYEDALDHYRKSLPIKRRIGDRHGVAHTLTNIGIVYKHQGAYEEALSQYRASLSILREVDDREAVSNALNNIGTIHRMQGRLEVARDLHSEALSVKQAIGDRGGIANTHAHLGDLYRRQGQLHRALYSFGRALDLNREMRRTAHVASNLTAQGRIRLEQDAPTRAHERLSEAVELVERLRRQATSPESRRSLLSTQIEAYRALAVANVRCGRAEAALQATEHARARLLADRLAGAARGDTSRTVPSTARLQGVLEPREAAVLYTNVVSGLPLAAVLVTRDSIWTRRLPEEAFRRRLNEEYGGELTDLRQRDGLLVRALGTERARIDTGGVAEAVRLYRHHLTRVDGRDSVQTGLSHMLHDLLVRPVQSLVAGTRDLTIVPTGALSYLPIEALRDSEGSYLIEKANVRYAQSLTVLHELRKQPDRTYDRPLLAFGGADYGSAPPSEAAPLVAEAERSVETEEHASALLRSAERRIEQGRSLRSTYSRLGLGSWAPLFGTKLEVRKLGRIEGDGATVYTDRAVSEPDIRRLSETGALRRYRRIHFATHGVALPQAPELSGLVLSQHGVSDSLAARDGYLTMREIAALDLQAEVAVLSACRTGLGRMIAGEGVVNLSHAFLRAGARATLVSQWRVLDWSTQQFMASVYREAAKGASFVEAVARVKRSFISGEFGKRNVDPLRWAPFVYYGRF